MARDASGWNAASYQAGYSFVERGTLLSRLSRFIRRTWSLTLESGGAMSDGREERQERAMRREQEKREDREDRIVRDDADEWAPERVDS